MSAEPRSYRRRAWSDEEGVALVGVLLAVVVLFGLSVVFVATATFETRSTSGSRDFETAVHVAEGAIDHLIPAINFEPGFYSTDGDHPDGFPRPEDRAEIIALGEDAAEEDLVRLAEGEGFAIRPVDGSGEPLNEIWSVGWVPNRANPVRVRALRIEFDRFRYKPEFGLFTGGPLTFGGDATVTGDFGNVHTNQNATSTGSSFYIEGDFTASGPMNVDCGQVDGACHGDAQPQPEPEISAREIHRLHHQAAAPWFDLCPPVGTTPATVRPWSAGGPCTSDTILWTSGDSHHYRGWRYHQSQWKTHQTMHTGVYYVHERNAEIGSMDEFRAVTVIAEEKVGDGGAASGHIRVTGAARLEYALAGLTLVADRDILMSGNSQVRGLIAANEQISISGEVVITGAALAQNAKNTLNSDIDCGSTDGCPSHVSGEMQIIYDDELDVPLTGVIRIISWDEL